MKDGSGDIRYEKVCEWMLPRCGPNDDTNFFSFMAVRMRNYMVHLMNTQGYKPRHYDPSQGKIIENHHFDRFYGCHMARMLCGFPSIKETWSTHELLDAIAAVKESMPKDAYCDMYRCMHFSDDCGEEDGGPSWEDTYPDEKYGASANVKRHRRKYEHIEDGFNKRWKYCVKFGMWITANESRVAGWYKSDITIFPEA